MEVALAHAAAKERRATEQEDIKADLLRGKDPVRIAADHGVPLYVVLRIKAGLR
jgi:hypothetical protein